MAAAFGGWSSQARALDLLGVQPAALDQPQINAIVYQGNASTPLIGQTEDPLGGLLGGDTVSFFNVQAYLDTGASSILISTPTAQALGLQGLTFNGSPVIYSDVGVAGTDDFQVSQPLRLSLANFYPRTTDLDTFLDVNSTQPDVSPYTPLPSSNNLYVEVGPYQPLVDNPGGDDIDQVINELLAEENAVDVIGMPAIQGHVMVMDTSAVKQLGQFFDIIGGALTGQGDLGDLSDADFNTLATAGMRTYLYTPGTPFHPLTVDTDPGIPSTQLHVKLSYASFDRFTTVTPSGQPGPTLTHNPIIGKDPVKILDGISQPDTPGITITRNVSDPGGSHLVSSEGNWLLDTGAAASIVSQAQAARLGIHYQAGTFGTTAPILVDENGIPLAPDDTFSLAISGIGGTETLAGFFVDELTVPTIEGTDSGNDAYNLHFQHAPLLVGDITIKDPVTGQTLTLDGVFGMNYMVQSINFETDSEGNLLNIGTPSPSYFQYVTFDEPNGILGFSIDPESGLALPVPEPASLAMLSAGALLLLRRRR